MPPAPKSLPTDSDLLVLASPAFDAPPPALHHAGLIPPSVLHSMEGTWTRRRFEERPVRILRLRDVWVAKEGLVFDQDGALYRETITQHSEAEVAWAQAAVLAAIAAGSEPVDRDGPVVLCKKRGVGNYGHWMMEMLPRAHLVASHLPDLAPRFLVADVPGQIRTSMLGSLALLGIDQTRTVAVGDNPHCFDELILVVGLAEHGIYMSPLVMDCITALSDAVAASRAGMPHHGSQAHPPPPAARLFVSRQAKGFRRLVDEDRLLLEAQGTGWIPVEPALLPLSDQIALFSGAGEVAGVMGAAMTNIAFLRPGSRAVLLTPAGMPDTFFWFIATLRGLDYVEVRCTQTGPVRGVMPWDNDLILDPADATGLFGIARSAEGRP